MLFWIDATQPGTDVELFSLTLLERQIRVIKNICNLNTLSEKTIKQVSAHEAQLVADLKRKMNHGRATEIRIELPDGASIPQLSTTLGDHIKLTWSINGKPLIDRLRSAIEDAKDAPVIGMSADNEIDERLVTHLASRRINRVFFVGEGEARCAAFRVSGEIPDINGAVKNVVDIADSLLRVGAAKHLDLDGINRYIPNLRRSLDYYLFRVTDTQTTEDIERTLFESNYKGATDFMTKYVYPPLVWRMVRQLAKRQVHPNTITIIAIIATIAAVPFFAAGAWIPALILAFSMSILDSVDGKLARLTFTSSPQGNLLDHGTDLIHPPFWYCAWAWGLSGGDPFSGVFQASLWLMGIYTLDRVLEQLFKVLTGRSVQDIRPIDIKLRTFVSRRNVNLALFAVALPLGLGIQAFYAVVVWQALTALYHFVRVVQFWGGDPEADAIPDRKETESNTADELADVKATP